MRVQQVKSKAGNMLFRDMGGSMPQMGSKWPSLRKGVTDYWS